MNFRVDFGAEDEVRLSPFKDDNPKDTENSTFEASSLLVVKANRYYNSNEFKSQQFWKGLQNNGYFYFRIVL